MNWLCFRALGISGEMWTTSLSLLICHLTFIAVHGSHPYVHILLAIRVIVLGHLGLRLSHERLFKLLSLVFLRLIRLLLPLLLNNYAGWRWFLAHVVVVISGAVELLSHLNRRCSQWWHATNSLLVKAARVDDRLAHVYALSSHHSSIRILHLLRHLIHHPRNTSWLKFIGFLKVWRLILGCKLSSHLK